MSSRGTQPSRSLLNIEFPLNSTLNGNTMQSIKFKILLYIFKFFLHFYLLFDKIQEVLLFIELCLLPITSPMVG